MKANIGRLDQLIRTGISVALIYVGFINEDLIKDPFSSNIIGTIGIVNFIVLLTRFCPLYHVVDINTCQKKSQ